jgi:RND superfamily putative drug exporter
MEERPVLDRLATVVIRRRRLVLAVTGVLLGLAAVVGGGVANRLSAGGFTDPGVESSRAADVLEHTFGQGDPNVVLVVAAAGGVDRPADVRAGRALTARLADEPGVTQVVSYWTEPVAALRSHDGSAALVLARITGNDDRVADRVSALGPRYIGEHGPLTVHVGGVAEIYHEVNHQIRSDLARAEIIALPVTLALLLIIFASGIAALMPLAIAGVAVLGSFLALTVISELTPVSIFALNMVTALGLGLAIDYALFVVSRYREELASGRDVEDAIRVTLMTAGRTVVFSSMTVALSLAALLIFPLYFLRSFAYAGVAVTVLAGLGAVVVLPALLAVVGRRIDRYALRRRAPKPADVGFWHRVATAVMRRPLPVAVVVVGILVVLGLPFRLVSFGLPDDRVLPRSAQAHQASQLERHDFPGGLDNAISVVMPRTGTAPAADRVGSYATRLSDLPHVSRVEAATGTYAHGTRVAGPDATSARFAGPDAAWLRVVPSVYAYSDAGTALTRAVRAAPSPYPVLVGGSSAALIDTEHSIAARIPIAGLLIAVATFVLLFLFTGSVVIPIKALLLNLLSLSATFGAMVFIFQQGHLRGLVGDFIPTGHLDTTTPILMFCVAFGLSMDYEVFLLSRIREEYLRTGQTTSAVALGLERTGRLITAAAALLAVVFLAFSTSSITFIKLFGIGMALAVIVDATLVRGALVPAFMRLAGKYNWWAPAPLRRLHDRIGLSEDVGAVVPTASGPVDHQVPAR